MNRDSILYNTEKGSFAKYKGDIPYNISDEFVQALDKPLSELFNICKKWEYEIKINNKSKAITFNNVFCGQLYHYGFSDKQIREIKSKSSVKLPDGLYVEIEGKKANFIHGFNTLINNVSDDNKKDVKKYINEIKSIIWIFKIQNHRSS